MVGEIDKRVDRQVDATLDTLEVFDRDLEPLGELRLRLTPRSPQLGDAATDLLGHLLGAGASHRCDGGPRALDVKPT